MSDCPIKDECISLFRRLYLPDNDTNRLTTTKFGIIMRKKILENKELEPVIIQAAKKIFKEPHVERGCPDDDRWES